LHPLSKGCYDHLPTLGWVEIKGSRCECLHVPTYWVKGHSPMFKLKNLNKLFNKLFKHFIIFYKFKGNVAIIQMLWQG
jgi:hypothetical protein